MKKRNKTTYMNAIRTASMV